MVFYFAIGISNEVIQKIKPNQGWLSWGHGEKMINFSQKHHVLNDATLPKCNGQRHPTHEVIQ